MKRDMDLVRKLAQWIEAQEQGRNINWKIAIEGYTDEQIGYHAYLMHQAGLLTATNATFMESHSPNWMPESLTWAGHEFLAAVSDDTIWAKAKTHVLKPAVGATFSILVEWLKAQAEARLGLGGVLGSS